MKSSRSLPTAERAVAVRLRRPLPSSKHRLCAGVDPSYKSFASNDIEVGAVMAEVIPWPKVAGHCQVTQWSPTANSVP